MRTTIIPAQITTVEDKIVGNLNFTQLILLLTPVLVSTFIYITLPKPMSITLYKIPLFLISFIIFGFLALRFKGRIILEWVGIISKYNLRPRFFVYDKNNLYLRDSFELKDQKEIKHKLQTISEKKNLSLSKLLTQEEKFLQQKVGLTFKSKKGKVYVAVD